jgi:hypothetical protein
MFGAVGDFELKLKLYRKQLGNINLCHFSSCNLHHRNGSVSVPFLTVHALEMMESLAEQLQCDSMTFLAKLEMYSYL